MRGTILVGVGALLQLAAAQLLCYYPDGAQSPHVPCNVSAAVSVCCGSVQACLPNGLCRNDDTTRDAAISYTHGTCTDASWTSAFCPGEHLLNQDDASESSDYALKARRGLQTTTAVASAATATGTSGSGGGLGTGAKAGIGIGAAVGIIALAAAAYFRRRARLRKAAGNGGLVDDEKHGGVPERNGLQSYEMDVTRASGPSEKGAKKQTAPVICEGGTCSKLRMVGA